MEKVIAISDTHNYHNNLALNQFIYNIVDKENSLIIHAGDITSEGTFYEVVNFFEWFNKLPFKYNVMIAGNHELIFEHQPELIDELLKDYPNIIYLNDSGIELDGKKIYGSPVQPTFHNWAFNRYRGHDISKHWKMIPLDTDILVTHGPPYSIGDKNINQENCGCIDLLRKVKKVKPIIHIFGHIHEGYSETKVDDTVYINASILNRYYIPTNNPIIFNL